MHLFAQLLQVAGLVLIAGGVILAAGLFAGIIVIGVLVAGVGAVLEHEAR